MKKGIFIALIALIIGVFVISGWKVLGTLWEYHVGKNFYADMEQYIVMPESEDEKAWPEVDFDALQAINPDVVGWIYIPGTQVNYPILQGETNDDYIYHLMTGANNSSGSIFLEADIPSNFSAQNNPIYGHHMKNGTMFADIAQYQHQDYYEAHPYAMLMTPDGNYYVRIFSGYETDLWGEAWKTYFSGKNFEQWLREVEQNSCFPAHVTPTTADKIVTFSTCTYELDNTRFVVHGVLEAYDG